MDKNQLQSLIYKYHWQSKEVVRLRHMLFGIDIKEGSLTQQYGLEATLPKPNTNIKSKYEMDELDARERRQYERYLNFKRNTDFVESLLNEARNDQEMIILDCMMEGMSYRSIADHLGVSRYKIGEMKDDMFDHLCQICQLCQNQQHLHREKCEV